MKKTLAVGLLTTIVTTQAFAHLREECRYRTNRWGDRVRICRTIDHHRHHHVDGDDVAVGAVIVGGALVGAGVVALADSCAPEVVKGNISATESALDKLAADEKFAGQKEFLDTVKAIKELKDEKKKIAALFALVDVDSQEDIAYFIGARKSEYAKYADVLEKNVNLDGQLSSEVVETLVTSLKGSLR